MLGTIHLLVGAMIGATLPNNAAIVVVALCSHYILDAVPHIDPGTFRISRSKPSWTQSIILGLDMISMIAFALIFYKHSQLWFPILLGSVVAVLPDFLMPLYRRSFFYPFGAFHDLIHWRKEKARKWSWYLAGIFSQALVSLLAFVVISIKQDIQPITSWKYMEFAHAKTVSVLNKIPIYKHHAN